MAKGEGIAVVSIDTPCMAPEVAREQPSDLEDSHEARGAERTARDVRLFDYDEEPPAVKLSVIMAAYNEERTIIKAVRGILQVDFPCEFELIVVDDGSTDATPDLLKEIDDPRVVIHRHVRNQGKGASILTAVSLATGTHFIPFDADLEYAPEDIANVVAPVVKGRCQVVYGARLFGYNTVYQSYRYAMGNKVMTHFMNILYDAYLADLHTCLKLIPLAFLRDMNLSETGFGLDTQITALLLRRGVRPFEVPVSYHSRSHDQGKKINWRDAVKCVWILVRMRVSRRAQPQSLLVR